MKNLILTLVLIGISASSAHALTRQVVCGSSDDELNAKLGKLGTAITQMSDPSVAIAKAAPGVATGGGSYTSTQRSKVETSTLICVTVTRY